ncbi:nuclear transport factor 2 family protein [Undibacterium sp. Jales W-56]|uniref:YybH family protein n=1 Tax=Undibacterium sp. Jales W-56 TaxID=2897325 RepID=UPI0021D38641|nr:nuclear transport factor 2 family protein [Undibacterium sp. Jales W-56]MCU6435271.1 nuclear transport factor 2 family protein [Undibacterium sp. Jales W-56]
MQYRVVLSLLIATISVQVSAAPASAPNDALSSFYAALASGDRTKALALLSPSVAIYEAGHVESSREEYASHHLAGDIAFAKTSTRKVRKHSEKVEGNLAVIWEETETTTASGSKPGTSYGTETALLENVDGQWRITHVHWSSRKGK